jgi:small membrane protein
MIAPALLSLLLCSVLVYAWVEYRRSPVVALFSVAASFAGLYFVWVPSHSTLVAEFVGVGRGADLVLYLWVCISLIVLLNLHLKLRTQHELITKLARTIAIANVASPAVDAQRTLSVESASQMDAMHVEAGRHTSRQMRDQIA